MTMLTREELIAALEKARSKSASDGTAALWYLTEALREQAAPDLGTATDFASTPASTINWPKPDDSDERSELGGTTLPTREDWEYFASIVYATGAMNHRVKRFAADMAAGKLVAVNSGRHDVGVAAHCECLGADRDRLARELEEARGALLEMRDKTGIVRG